MSRLALLANRVRSKTQSASEVPIPSFREVESGIPSLGSTSSQTHSTPAGSSSPHLQGSGSASQRAGEKRPSNVRTEGRQEERRKKQKAQVLDASERHAFEGSPSGWHTSALLSPEEVSPLISAGDQEFLASLSSSSLEGTSRECTGWLKRIIGFQYHVIQRNISLTKENENLKKEVAKFEKERKALEIREAAMTELEQDLSSKKKQLEEATLKVNELQLRVDDLSSLKLELQRDKKELEQEKVDLMKLVEDSSKALKDKEEELSKAMKDLEENLDLAAAISIESFENALDQVRLLYPSVQINASNLFSYGVVEGRCIVDVGNKKVLFEAPTAEAIQGPPSSTVVEEVVTPGLFENQSIGTVPTEDGGTLTAGNVPTEVEGASIAEIVPTENEGVSPTEATPPL